MATYKVIQDIEAEDKLLGSLTLRQFIYAAIAAVSAYICVLGVTKGAPFLVVIFLPIILGAGFFAFPWKGEQPTEIWALARLRFALKPRVRIWDQDGVKDLVTVLAPKRLEIRHSYKDDLSQSEVRSRLKALASTIDSRGWATRNAAYGAYGQWSGQAAAAVPGFAPVADVSGADIFDNNNSVAQNLDAMLSKSSVQLRQRAEQAVINPQPPQPQAMQCTMQAPQLPAPVMPAYISQSAGSAIGTVPASYGAAPAGTWFTGGPSYPTMPQPYGAPGPQATTPLMAQQPQPVVAPPMQATPPPQPQWQQPTASEPSAAQPQWQQLATPAAEQAYPQQSQSNAGQPLIESDAPLAIAATPTPEETQMAQDIRQQNQAAMAVNYGHMRVLQPAVSNAPQTADAAPIDYTASLGAMSQQQSSAIAAIAAAFGTGEQTAGQEGLSSDGQVTHTPDPAILELANNDDLDIATIARQANKQMKQAPDEVEIRLH